MLAGTHVSQRTKRPDTILLMRISRRPPGCWVTAVASDRPPLEEDVALFAMLAEVEALDLLLLRHTQAHRGVEHLEQDEGDDGGEDPGDRRWRSAGR